MTGDVAKQIENHMSGAFTCGKNYLYLSNVRCRVLIEAAIEVATELAVTDEERTSVDRLIRWWKEGTFPGIDLDLDRHFQTMAERKLWAQAFETLGWRVFHRCWGNQENQTWQVGFISHCHVVSRMITSLVWQEDRTWYPANGDEDGMLPDPMRIQQ